MKKYFKILIGGIVLGSFALLGFTITKKITHKTEIASQIQTLPEFSFNTMDNQKFTLNKITKSQTKLFIYFNSECDFCHGEAKQIKENIEQLKNVQIIFVSYQEKQAIKEFADQHQLAGFKNIIFLEDEKLEFSKIFGANTIPYMFLYSEDNKLVETFKGATKLENILKHINSL